MCTRQFAKISVLIVEDDIAISMALAIALRDSGFHVCGRAAEEFDAIALAGECHPDAAVVDLRLKSGCGKSAATKLSHTNVRVVVASGEQDGAQFADELGVPYLRKPYRVPDLLKALERVLGRVAPEHELRLA